MTRQLPAALGAACLLAIGASPAPAATVHYCATLDVAGTWTESVRADAVTGEGPPAQVQSRDSSMGWSLTAAMRDVALRDSGRLAAPVTEVADTNAVQTSVSSAFTDFDGEGGTCTAKSAAATGSGEIIERDGGFVMRPSSDVPFELDCRTPHVHYSIAVDLLRPAASPAPTAVGDSPLDALFDVPADRVGDTRIVVPVAATAYQRSLERCPREDRAHTTACSFAWAGTVAFDRTSPIVRRPRLAGDRAGVTVTCFVACAPRVRAADETRRFRLGAGETRRLSVPVGRTAERVRVTVRIGKERTVVIARR